VLKKGKIYVPKDGELRAEIIWLHHNVPVVSRSLTVDFILFFLFYFFYFSFSFSFYLPFLEQLGLGLIGHAVTSVTKLMA